MFEKDDINSQIHTTHTYTPKHSLKKSQDTLDSLQLSKERKKERKE